MLKKEVGENENRTRSYKEKLMQRGESELEKMLEISRGNGEERYRW